MAEQRRVKVTGPPGKPVTMTIPCRRPIKELMTDEVQWSLYIRALREMQNKPWNSPDQVSYWQIASLHGLPYQLRTSPTETIPYSWDTVKKSLHEEWCAHFIPTFPTWHRPYVSLFEQTLVQTAVELVKNYEKPLHPAWSQAAETLRAPYWDWASDACPPDEVIEYKELSVLGFNGEYEIITPNPLFSYTYPIDPKIIPIERSLKTTRQPSATTGETDVYAVRDALQGVFQPKKGDSMRTQIYTLLMQTNKWELVSNEGSGPDDEDKFRNGLEQPHGKIHGAIGGDGTMGDIDTAGFDPSFMLHHAQVDRLLALWQTIHSDSWIPDGPEGIDKSLTPFWDGNQEFTSRGPVREFRQFAYRYPEFVGIPDDAKKASAFMKKKVEQLYGMLPEPKAGPVKIADSAAAAAPRDWLAHVRIPLKSVQESFTVYFFVGHVPENPRAWLNANNLAGTYTKFARSHSAQCANCENLIAKGVESHAIVDLTPALKMDQKYHLPDKEIEQYLSDNLQWRILKNDRTVIEPHQLEGFLVSGVTLKLKTPNEDGPGHMPMFPDPNSPPVYHDAITSGKPGGRSNS